MSAIQWGRRFYTSGGLDFVLVDVFQWRQRILGALTAFIFLITACGAEPISDGGNAGSTESAESILSPEESIEGSIDVKDPTTGATPAASAGKFEYDGTARRYMLYTPTDLPDEAPLVFMLHGYTSNPHITQLRTKFNFTADENGFAVVYPHGSTDYEGKSHWNAKMRISETDDVGFLSALARHLQEEHGFSETNTFVAGFSNGGFMSYVLAMDAPGVFRAAASVTGTMSGEAWKNRSASSARFPLLQISGLEDKSIPMDGTRSQAGGWGGAPDIHQIIDYWSELNGCNVSETTQISEHAELLTNSGCENGVEILLMTINGFGHDWPTEDNIAGIEGASFIWNFFSRFVE